MTKAHKILGSTYISIDSAKSWDDVSNSGLSVSVSESTVPTSTSSNRPGRAALDGARKVNHAQRDWENDSDVVPHHIRINEPIDDSDGDCSDISRRLREQPSTSTIKSWYDKTKQPLSVTQQTSASAMAKGLPPKAQKLLDVENTQPAPKARKKPSKLDLSRLKLDHRGGKDWDSQGMLGNEYVNRSPSNLSTPLTPSSAKYRQRLQKRPTKENLRRQQAEPVPALPSPAGERVSPRQAPNMSELPSLYKHYEQMSFAQVMVGQDDDSHPEEAAQREPLVELPEERHYEKAAPTRREPAHAQQPWPPRKRDDSVPDPLNSHPTQQTRAPSPQVLQVTTSDKIEQPSPTDCGASISSRHTRTSKASKHTEKSFQTADFIDKSVLMLSSDSEDDEEGNNYTELSAPAKKTAGSPSAYRPSSNKSDASDGPHHAHASNVEESSARQSNQTIRRTSAAPAGFLTIPSRFSTTSSPTTSPSTDSRASGASSHWGTTFHASSTPSLTSNASGSSGHTATSNQATPYAVQEARAVHVLPTQAPTTAQRKAEDGGDSDLEYDEPDAVVRQSPSTTTSARDSPVTRAETTVSASSQSISSKNSSYAESYDEDQSLEDSGSLHEHFMGLTRQEQMLITALRQRRESMRKTGNQRADSRPRMGHNSKESEATITEESFNLTFPVPPKAGTGLRKSSSVSSSMIGLTIPGPKDGADGSNQSVTADGTVFLLSPPPSHHHPQKSKAKRVSRREARQSEHEQMLLYLDHAGGPALAIKEGIMSPDTPSFTNPGSSSGWPAESMSPPSLRRQRSNIETSVRPARDHAMLRKHHDSALIIDEETLESLPPFPPPTRALPAPPQSSTSESDAGIPRPDSPISAMASVFPEVPQKRRTINTQMARLSAFGPPKALQPGWWGDED